MDRPDQALFGIVQGGIFPDLREESATFLASLDFPGYAIGGLSVGETKDQMYTTLDATLPCLPSEKPRYLMGVGMPVDIVEAVRAGVDMFDCVLPTRNGRNAYAFTENGPLRLRNNVHIQDARPIEVDCDCYCCRNFSRASLRHFFNSGEMLGPILVSLHNITFYQRLMSRIRQAIKKSNFDDLAKRFDY